MERSVKGLLGGGLKPNDPRRFLIEAMVGAMHADGVADRREADELERQIATHPLFHGLSSTAARTLIQLSNDALEFAGTPLDRVSAIAKGLPARIHRLAAFGMAAEVAASDRHLADGELHFLEALRIALRIAPLESEALVGAAHSGRLGDYLDDRYQRIKTLIPVAAEVFVLRALGRGGATDEQRFLIRDFFAAIPDLSVPKDELDGVLYQSFRRPRAPDAQVFGELARVAQTLPDPVDRYWMMVYTLVAEQPATVPSWRVIPFTGVMQMAFQIVDTDMELAVVDALTFPAAMPRPM
jgi:uncharacterized tellurite resistance protein B-like protein